MLPVTPSSALPQQQVLQRMAPLAAAMGQRGMVAPGHPPLPLLLLLLLLLQLLHPKHHCHSGSSLSIWERHYT